MIKLLAFTTILVAAAAHSQVTLTYTGQPMVDRGGIGQSISQFETIPPYVAQRLMLTLTLDEPLAANLNNAPIYPTSSTFSDGIQTILPPTGQANNDYSSYWFSYRFSTDSAGKITSWQALLLVAPSTTPLIAIYNLSINSTLQGDTEFATSPCGIDNLLPGSSPMCTEWNSAPAGHWTQSALLPSAAPPSSTKVLQCAGYKVIAPTNWVISNISPNPTGNPSLCVLPANTSSSYYIKTTTNGGASWVWSRTLGSLGLGK